jgi:hypothetical protein
MFPAGVGSPMQAGGVVHPPAVAKNLDNDFDRWGKTFFAQIDQRVQSERAIWMDKLSVHVNSVNAYVKEEIERQVSERTSNLVAAIDYRMNAIDIQPREFLERTSKFAAAVDLRMNAIDIQLSELREALALVRDLDAQGRGEAGSNVNARAGTPQTTLNPDAPVFEPATVGPAARSCEEASNLLGKTRHNVSELTTLLGNLLNTTPKYVAGWNCRQDLQDAMNHHSFDPTPRGACFVQAAIARVQGLCKEQVDLGLAERTSRDVIVFRICACIAPGDREHFLRILDDAYGGELMTQPEYRTFASQILVAAKKMLTGTCESFESNSGQRPRPRARRPRPGNINTEAQAETETEPPLLRI